ncbi:MAG: A24 family peptidase [Candidatus Binatia bacterium]
MEHIASLFLLSSWTAAAIVYDWRSRRLPNVLTLGAMACGLASLLLFSQGPLGASWLSSLFAGMAALAILLPPYITHAMGAGDVKFFMAMGLLGGPIVLLPTLLVGSLLAGAMAVWVLACSGRWPLLSLILERWRVASLLPTALPQRPLPFGVPLGIGFLLTIWGVMEGQLL